MSEKRSCLIRQASRIMEVPHSSTAWLALTAGVPSRCMRGISARLIIAFLPSHPISGAPLAHHDAILHTNRWSFYSRDNALWLVPGPVR